MKTDEPHLFTGSNLHDHLEAEKREALRAVQGTQENVLLEEDEATQIDWIVQESSIDFPELMRDGLHVSPIEDTTVWTDGSRGPIEVPGQAITVQVPFRGEAKFFSLKPNLLGPAVPQGAVRNDLITVRFETPGTFDRDSVMRRWASWLDDIDRWLRSSSGFVERYHSELRPLVEKALRERRQRVQTARDVEASLPVPVIRKGEPVAYDLPTKRRRPRPAPRPAASKANREAEMKLADEDYEEAIRITRSWATTIERTPITSRLLGEEDYRNLLLGVLNSHFEGAAGGELFNGEGRIDILIRERDNNVFIAECKIWDGQQTVTDAVDQVLTYLSWRDTKAAVILFVRNSDFSGMVDKALKALEKHPQRTASIPSEDPTRRSDFELTDPRDPARVVTLAFLPVSIRTPAPNLEDDPPPADG